MFAYSFRGLILAPDELRKNSERTLALSVSFSGAYFFGVELFGFWSHKNTRITAVVIFRTNSVLPGQKTLKHA